MSGNKCPGCHDHIAICKCGYLDKPLPRRFRRGQRVRKISGYKFEGRVCGTFDYFDKPERFVNVQHDDGWVMHFREKDLESAPTADNGV